MIVYIIIEYEEYAGGMIKEVLSSKRKAENHLKKYKNYSVTSYEIEEWEIK
jgi:hypothetical protein